VWPWEWRAGHLEEWIEDLAIGPPRLHVSTLRALRQSYVTHLIEDGFDPLFVQMQVGHRHPSTTAIYTAVNGDYKQRALADALAAQLAPGQL
jgi:site-specific recombinase XerD